MDNIAWRRVLACLILCLPLSIVAHAQAPRSLADAAAQCMDDALRKEGRATTPLSDASALLQIERVFATAADCRFALQAMPADKRMIVAEHLAAEALTILAVGVNGPTNDKAIYARVVQECGKVQQSQKIMQSICAFYMGSAFEYGVGVKADRNIAWKWYLLAGQAGSEIASREAARLEQSLRQ